MFNFINKNRPVVILALVLIATSLFQLCFVSNIDARENSVSAKEKISKKIEQLIKNTDPDINIGVKITNLDSSDTIYSRNENRYFSFGSALKLFATISLYDYYGPKYQFKSQIVKKGNDLYFSIHDPEFCTKDLDSMLARYKKEYGSTIKGNFYIIEDQFSVPFDIRTKTLADVKYCNGAGISKLHINKNCPKLLVTPTNIGQKLKINTSGMVPYKIVNNTKTVPNREWDRLHTRLEGNSYVVDGTLSKITGKAVISATTSEGPDYVRKMVRAMLKKKAITLKGKLKFAKSKPQKGQLLISNVRTMHEVAAELIKVSDNFMTDYLIAQFGTDKGAKEWRMAIHHLKKLIKKRYDVDLSGAKICDGSGISRASIFKVNHFDAFLKAILKDRNKEELFALMTMPGERGTLRNRLKEFKGQNKIFTKTGSLGGVCSLMGYFYDKNNQLHSFVIVINNYVGDRTKYLKLEDDIVRLFI